MPSGGTESGCRTVQGEGRHRNNWEITPERLTAGQKMSNIEMIRLRYILETEIRGETR